MYHSRSISTSCSLANSESISASGRQWKARSQAAYHGILPLVRHGDHVGIVEVPPFVVAAVPALGGRRRKCRVAVQPVAHHVVVKLLGPEQAGEGLPHHGARIVGKIARGHRGVEFVGLADAIGEDLRRSPRRRARPVRASVSRRSKRGRLRPAQTPACNAPRALVPRCSGFTAVAVAVHHVIGDAVLDVR